MKRLSGKQSYLGKTLSRLVSSVSPIGKQGYVLYGPNEDDPLVPDLRVGHNDQWFRILTGDPSSAGQPLSIVNEPFTITVHHDPAEQADYTTVRDALLYCAQFYAPPNLTDLFGTVLIKSGHVEKAQTQISGADLRWVEVISEDLDVVVDSFAMAGDPFFGGSGNALWLMRDCQLPVLKTHFVNDGLQSAFIVGFNLTNCTSTLPARDTDYYTNIDLYGVPGKRYGCSGFDINLVCGGTTQFSAMPSAKFANCRRDENVAVAATAVFQTYGGDYTGYGGQCSVRSSGYVGLGSLPTTPPALPFRLPPQAPGTYQYDNPADFRKNPGGPPAVHDIFLAGPHATLNRRGGFLGTCNIPVNTTIIGQGGHYFHQSVRNPRAVQVDMLAFEVATRKEMLPDARAYRHALAAVREGYEDDGEGVLTLYLSDRGEWRPLQAGGLALPSAPTFTDNGDGTFTLT